MYDFNVSLFGRMGVSVVADSREEAERILKETIDGISVKDMKEKESNNQNITINESYIATELCNKTKDKDVER